jgi:hypothetical protein
MFTGKRFRNVKSNIMACMRIFRTNIAQAGDQKSGHVIKLTIIMGRKINWFSASSRFIGAYKRPGCNRA